MSQPEFPVPPDADETNARLREAASSLYDFFDCGRPCPWIQSIGEKPIGKYNPTASIAMMLVRHPMAHEGFVPKEWGGFPVESMVVGRLFPLGADPNTWEAT